MARAYRSENGTWCVEKFSHTGYATETVAFRLTQEMAEALEDRLRADEGAE